MKFLCDYLRLMTLGTDNPHEVESLIDQELETHHREEHRVSHAPQQLAESFPGLGIVAAVRGDADRQHLVPDLPNAAINRRVEITLLRSERGPDPKTLLPPSFSGAR